MEQKKLVFIQENAPCYLYDRQQITERCQILHSAMPEELFLYSIKANPFIPVVSSAASQEFGADAASASEVLLAERAGIPRELIFYSAPGKTAQDIEKTWDKCTIIADSFSELHLLEQIAAGRNKSVSVGVRVNPRFSIDGAVAVPSKFGIDEDQLLSSAISFSHLKIAGIHIHVRSQILDADLLCEYYRNCYKLAERINKMQDIEISFINFGSGIGTVYDAANEKPLAFEKIGQGMRELHKINERSLKAKFILETGRFLVCNAGNYYTRVVDRKESCGKTFVVVQNAMNGFFRPAFAEILRQNLGIFPTSGQEPLYTSGSQCTFQILGRETKCNLASEAKCNLARESDYILEREANLEKVDIVGNLCTSLDVIARDIILPHVEIGDILEISNAGSYGYTLTPQLFSSQESVKEFLWED